MSGSEDKSAHDFCCSFCGKGRQEVAHLISGPMVFICDECVELCNDIIVEERAKAVKDAEKKGRKR